MYRFCSSSYLSSLIITFYELLSENSIDWSNEISLEVVCYTVMMVFSSLSNGVWIPFEISSNELLIDYFIDYSSFDYFIDYSSFDYFIDYSSLTYSIDYSSLPATIAS